VGANAVVVTQQLLHGTDIASVFQQVRGERMSEAAESRAREDVAADGLDPRALDDGLVKMMAPALPDVTHRRRQHSA
jgi:hypothetical protein